MKVEAKFNGKNEQELRYKRNQLQMAIKVRQAQIELLETQIKAIDIQIELMNEIDCWMLENER